MANDYFIGRKDRGGNILSLGKVDDSLAKMYEIKDEIIIGGDNQLISEIKKDADDLSEIASRYLEEHYIIYEQTNGKYGRPRPKSPEQAANEQTQINIKIMEALTKLTEDVKTLSTQIQPKSTKSEVI